MKITKEQLENWRHVEGLTNVQIADRTGKSLSRINALFSIYQIKSLDRGISKQTIEKINDLRKSGRSINEIMEETGLSRSSINKYISKENKFERYKKPVSIESAAAGVESYVFELPRKMINERKPKIFRTVINGKRYLDITDLFM